MLELNRHNRPVKVTNHTRKTSSNVLTLPNAAALPVAELPASGLPAKSMRRIVNPAEVPLTPEERFAVRIG